MEVIESSMEPILFEMIMYDLFEFYLSAKLYMNLL
jgi:hypothetical protein